MFAPLLDHTAVDSLIYYPLNNQLINLKDHTTADNQSIRQDHTAVYNWIHYPLDNQSIKTSIHQSLFTFILLPAAGPLINQLNLQDHTAAVYSWIYYPLDNQ